MGKIKINEVSKCYNLVKPYKHTTMFSNSGSGSSIPTPSPKPPDPSPSITVQPLVAVKNGVYTAQENTAYNPVTVDVPQTTLESLVVTDNGTYTSESGSAYNVVTVDVPKHIGPAEEKDVNFYDYDGTCLYSYISEEFLELTELPENPTHKGLTAQGWNWSLEDAQTYVEKYGMLLVGQMYITDDGATRLYVHFEEGRTSPYLGLAVDGTVTIDWGDDSEPDILTGSSLITVVTVKHTFEPGSYLIRLVPENDSKFVIPKSILTNGDTGTSYAYKDTIHNVEIGTGVDIGAHAFDICCNLKTITIPNSTTNIGEYSFASCFSLISITIPKEIQIIYKYCFTNCYSLACVSIPASVNQIGRNAFTSDVNLKRISIPDGVESIETDLFSDCFTLKQVVIPDGVTSIKNHAFSDCTELNDLSLPDSIVSIEDYAFYTCANLEDIAIPQSVTIISAYTFYYCWSLKQLIIPDGVTSIGMNAFRNCGRIKSLTIPSNVTTIGGAALTSLYNLSGLYFNSPSPPNISNSYVFDYLPTDCEIYVPSGSLAAYTSATNYPNKNVYTYVEY